MAKKNKKKQKVHRQAEGLKPPSWDSQTHLHGLVHRHDYETITTINKNTVILLGDEWENNVKENVDLWKKHIPLKSVAGEGLNKCTIGVGSGQSLNKNIDVLKHYVNQDGVKDWDDRDFLVIAANHQLKPLLEIGIIPDFVLLVDASDVVYDQLCKDIPKQAKHIQLIAGVHSSPKVLHEWDNQGRKLLFYLNPAPRCKDAFQKYIKKNPTLHSIDLGGNVLNGAFMVGITRFGSNVFCGVGHDLSFPVRDTLKEQRKAYYADGDYTSNAPKTGTGRDEANTTKRWAGF
ncbi:MAG: 6-hydroxymethylpterin diphosphokinase MptE-like protein, partial [Candidatus Thorarchaeota archaeon]